VKQFVDGIKANKLFDSIRCIVRATDQAQYSAKIVGTLDKIKLVAIECFEKSLQERISSDRRNTFRESLDQDEPFHDSSFKDSSRDQDSYHPSQKNKTSYFSAAISKIPDKKMSNISILDFKDILANSGAKTGRPQFREKAGSRFIPPGHMIDFDRFEEDYKHAGEDFREDSTFSRKEDSYLRTEETTRRAVSHKTSVRGSNVGSVHTRSTQPAPSPKRPAQSSGCCALI